MSPVILHDHAGVALFAATGAPAASRKHLDIVGFRFLASVTGTGGGTARDLILVVPVFCQTAGFVLVCGAMAVLVCFTAHLFESRYRLLLGSMPWHCRHIAFWSL